MQVKRALISVHDKTGVIEFAKELQSLGIEIISTGGTAKVLKECGIKVRDISEITGYPELLGGRVKTLHPKIQAGILALRDKESHMKELKKEGIGQIDIVVVNLYPFERTVQREHAFEEAIENIDIGGVTLLRAGAKNYKHVAIVSNPKDYEEIIKELKAHKLEISESTCKRLMLEAFSHTAHYDSIISEYFRKYFTSELPSATPRILRTHVSRYEEFAIPKYFARFAHEYTAEEFPNYLNLSFEKIQELRYGENPHQKAAFYKGFEFGETEPSIASATKLWGKELSYNNILDADAALELIKEFSEPTCAIIKHTNPTGVATASKLADAYKLAYETDKISPFGGIVVFNREVDKEAAEELSKLFLEVVIAPEFSEPALEILKKKKDLRILEVPMPERHERKGSALYSRAKRVSIRGVAEGDSEVRSVTGGLLVQDRDVKEVDTEKIKVVTNRTPTEEELKALFFAFKVVRHCKSNALVFAKGQRTVGIGLGQTSRVDSAYIAVKKGGENIKGSVMASDAFFPFRDAVDAAGKAGVTAIIQPGGSVRDKEVIAAADEYNIAMVFSGMRVFRH